MSLYDEIEKKKEFLRLYNEKRNIKEENVGSKVKTEKFRAKTFKFEGDKYLTGFYHLETDKYVFPSISQHKPFSYLDLVSDIFPQSKLCRYDHVIFSKPNVGELPLLLKGYLGSGKSQMLNRHLQILVANGYKAWTLSDSFNEDRNHYLSGFLDGYNEFIPFHVRYYLPHFMRFADNIQPIWRQRQNVDIYYYNTISEIADEIAKTPYTFHSIYSDCFSTDDKLRLFLLIYEYLRRKNLDYEAGERIVFYHHELSQIFPQTLTKGNHKLLELAANRFVEMRKFGLRFVGALQLSQELYYRLNFKFPLVQNFAQKLGEASTRAEKHALSYTLGYSNFERNGFFMTHKFAPLTEIKNYRLFTSTMNTDLTELLTDEEYKILEEKGRQLNLKTLRNFYVLHILNQYPRKQIKEIASYFALTTQTIREIRNRNTLSPSEISEAIKKVNASRSK